MAIAITDKEDMPNSNNIVVGLAELIAIPKGKKIHWVLPGGGTTSSKRYATEYARHLNKVIDKNVKSFERNLLWT